VQLELPCRVARRKPDPLSISIFLADPCPGKVETWRTTTDPTGGLVGVDSRKLAHERARAMRYNKLGMSQPSVLLDIDLACQNDECAGRDFAGGDEALARREEPAFTEPRQPIDFRRLQHGNI